MKNVPWRSWEWPYMLPTVLMVGSLAVMYMVGGDPDIAWALFVAPPLAFVIGVIFRPEHTWVVPTASAVLILLATFAGAALGMLHPDWTGVGWVLAMIGLAVGALVLPQWVLMWLGREISMRIGNLSDRAGGPRVPTS